MSSFNKVLLMGNLTRDPEMRYTQSGMAVVKFGLAVNRRYRNRNTNEQVEETTFVDLEGWGSQAETFNQYMRKGRPVFIEGRLRLDSWEGKDGQKRNKLLVVMENFRFLGSRGGDRDAPRDSSSRQSSGPAVQAGQVADNAGSGGAEDYDFDDIPF
jgi:single-strand DNA-binding protein